VLRVGGGMASEELSKDGVKIEDLADPERVDLVYDIVADILRGMGIDGVSPDAVIAAPADYEGDVLLDSPARFASFTGQLAFGLRFIGYPLESVARLTVRQLCELFVADTFPEPPIAPLSVAQYALAGSVKSPTTPAPKKDFPICFVLGCPRSGTTLLRSMLNVHDATWAPGELHLAQFESMAERAKNLLPPLLRYMPVPEIAARFGEPVDSFRRTFETWEEEDLLISEVYQHLYDADPKRLIVDKSPTYSTRPESLARIGETFPNAKFIHILRNPPDVIRSFVRLHLFKGVRALCERGMNPYQMGEVIWYAHNANIEDFLDDVPDERKYALRYEDLVVEPHSVLSEVCDLLALPFDRAMADPYEQSAGPVATGAGDLLIHVHSRVERRAPASAFYPLGAPAEDLAQHYGY
jgi:hypothetical protein